MPKVMNVAVNVFSVKRNYDKNCYDADCARINTKTQMAGKIFFRGKRKAVRKCSCYLYLEIEEQRPRRELWSLYTFFFIPFVNLFIK